MPWPDLVGQYSAWVELIGGVAVAIGLALPVACVLLIVDLGIEIYFIRFDAGFWDYAGGYEFQLALIAALAAVCFAQAARWPSTTSSTARSRADKHPSAQRAGSRPDVVGGDRGQLIGVGVSPPISANSRRSRCRAAFSMRLRTNRALPNDGSLSLPWASSTASTFSSTP